MEYVLYMGGNGDRVPLIFGGGRGGGCVVVITNKGGFMGI